MLSPARLTSTLACALACAGVWAGPAAASSDTYAYVTNQSDGTVTPVDVTTKTAGAAFSLGAGTQPSAIALAPKGTAHAGKAYVTERGSDKVVVLDVATDPAVPKQTNSFKLPTGSEPDAIAITPDGTTAYVADYGTGRVTAITLSGSYAQQQIKVGPKPLAVAITPNGELAYVIHTASSGGGTTVTPIVVVNHNVVGTSFGGVGASPQAIAINPNGTTGYVASASSGQLIPFSIPQEKTHTPINLPTGPWAVTTTTDGSKAYVVSTVQPSLTEINASTEQQVGSPLTIGNSPVALAIGPAGTSYSNIAYVVEQGNGTTDGSVVPVNLTAMTAGSAITVGIDPSAIVVSPWVPVTTGQTPYKLGDLGSAAKKKIKKHTRRPKLRGRRIKVGDQRVMLKPSVHGAIRRKGRRLCVGPKATVFFKLISKRLRHGKKVRLKHVKLLLGHHRKASKRHAPVRIKLRHLHKGFHTVVVKLTFIKHRIKHVRRHHHRVKVRRKVHLHKHLKLRFHVC